MADNFTANPGTGGATFASDDIAGVQYPRIKLAVGADGAAVDVSSAAPMPVVQTGTPALPTGAATETTIAAILAKIIAAPATESTLAALNTKVPAQGQATMAASQPVVIANNQSAIPVSPPAALLTSYNVAGVIAINTVLMTLDCSQWRSISVQCVSMGTTGVVTPEWSNDNTTWATATMLTPAGATATTFNAAGLWVLPVQARYLRLRLSTATTAGTTTLSVHQFDENIPLWLATQPVSGTVTATVTGGTVLPVTPTTTFTNSAATTNATSIKASAGTLWSIQATNINAAARYLKLYNKASAPTVGTDVPVLTILIPAGSATALNLAAVDGGSNGIRFATGIALALTTGAADTDTTAVAANEIKLATTFT